MLEQFYLPVTNAAIKVISAVLIFLISLIIGRFAGLIAANLIQELRIEELLETIGVKFFFARSFGTLVSLAIYIAGLLIALNQFGVATIFTIIISAFFALIIILGILLGAASLFRNLMAGMRLRKKYLSKKSIFLPEVQGKIIKVGYANIRVMTKEKDVLVVPFIALN